MALASVGAGAPDFSRRTRARAEARFWHDKITKIAKEFVGRNLSFALANDQEFPGLLQDLGVKEQGGEVR